MVCRPRVYHVVRIARYRPLGIVRDQLEHIRVVRRRRHQFVDLVAQLRAQRARHKVERCLDTRDRVRVGDVFVMERSHHCVRIIRARIIRDPAVDVHLLHALHVRERRPRLIRVIRQRAVRQHRVLRAFRRREVLIHKVRKLLEALLCEVALPLAQEVLAHRLLTVADDRMPCRVKVIIDQALERRLIVRRLQL